MPDGTGLAKFAKAYPERFHDVGIAEQHAVTFAAGLAAGGIKPFCAIYSSFLQRGYDQVLHDVAIQHLPVRFFLDRSGLVGDDGPTHHGVFDLSFLGMIPGMTIMAPRDPDELKAMVHFASDFDEGPIAVRYPRGSGDTSLPTDFTPHRTWQGPKCSALVAMSLCAPSDRWLGLHSVRRLTSKEAEFLPKLLTLDLPSQSIRKMITESARKTGERSCASRKMFPRVDLVSG